ncbi:MAG: cysteine synthase family protein [Acidimicrobiia bacterium]
MMRFESVLDLIGNTPMVGIHELSPNENVKIYLKLEGQNPVGSAKDRVALSMIKDAETKGLLTPGCTIVEPSSGNTGVGLALVCLLHGYKLIVVCADNVTRERIDLLKSFGAVIEFSPGEFGSNGAIARAKEMVQENPDYVMLYQYGNASNPKVHYESTAPEILKDCPEIDVFVAGLGTSGTLMGCSRFFKDNKPDVKIVAVEPPSGESVSGLRSLDDGFIPEIFDPELIDRKFMIRSEESIEVTRELLTKCGIFVGVSTGAIVLGAIKQAAKMESGTIVAISPDSGWKYLSAGIWANELNDVIKESEKTNFW